MMEELKGLTTEEIEEKTKQGKTNKIKIKANESILKIIRKNIFTYFNLIFLILAILLITSQSYRNLTFLIIITINILIGIFQQIKSKITLDKLSLLDKNDYIVIRNGKKGKISSDNLVEGDYVILEAGNQIPADAVVVSGKMYVNESLLTGEQDEIEKNINSNLMSGSFVISGKSVVKLTNVGDESFSSKIMKDSKKIKETKSEMISAIDKIVKFAGIIIIPIGLLLFWESYIVNGNTYKESVNSMVSALIGMIPEGLYLLTTVALAISAGKLARKKVILHDMKSIESLARVDVLCVDKTGTITNNKMKILDIFDEKENSFIAERKNSKLEILAKYVNTIDDNNITMDAIKEQLDGISSEKLSNISKENFNSKNKFSFIKIDENLTYKLGAPEILLDKEFENIKLLAQKYTTINIVTNHIEKFRKLEQQLQEKGIIATITNNKKKSLMKSQIIINIDFPKELLNKYNIYENAILVNIRGNMKIARKRFNGITINDYEIKLNNLDYSQINNKNQYNIRDIYEASFYKTMPYREIVKQINADKLEVTSLYGNNGAIS